MVGLPGGHILVIGGWWSVSAQSPCWICGLGWFCCKSSPDVVIFVVLGEFTVALFLSPGWALISPPFPGCLDRAASAATKHCLSGQLFVLGCLLSCECLQSAAITG